MEKKPEVIFAIDPGTDQSGWCVFRAGNVERSGVTQNADLLAMIPTIEADLLAVEMIASYGMAVGREVFATCVWIGRMVQAWPGDHRLVFRRDVKLHLCGTVKAKDSNVRQSLLDLFPRTGGGATPQVGTKLKPGPLFGVSSHIWPALGVAVTVLGIHP